MESKRVKPLSTITIITLLWLTRSVSGQESRLVEDVEALINRTLSCSKIQGISISLVKNNQTLLAKGYGTRDNSYPPENPLSRVTDNTKFCIGSITKTFTAVLLAHLLSDQSANQVQNVTWDTPVRDIFGPEFKMSDWIRTNMTTIRDLLAHRVGLASYNVPMYLGFYPLRSRQEYCRRFYLLEPVQSFRQSFKYDNLMFTLAACIIERLGGARYEDLMRERLWRPLQMNDTVFTHVGMNWTSDLSQSFGTTHGITKINTGLAETSPHEAAGAICTTPRDMALWMKFLISEGRHIQPRLVDPSILCTLWDPVSVHVRRTLRKPKSLISKGWTSYGLGTAVGDYRGYNMFGHDGSIVGFTSTMMILPDAEIGIYLSVNTLEHHLSINVPMMALTSFPVDRVLEVPEWVNETSVCNFISRRDLKYHRSSCPSLDKKHPPPKRECEHKQSEYFVGQYGHRLFGNITIEHGNTPDFLNIIMGRLGQGTLEPALAEYGCFFSIIPDAKLAFLASSFGGPTYVEFRNFQSNGYQNLINHAYSPEAPPEFVRGELWDRTPATGSGALRGAQSGHVIVKVSLILLIIVAR